MLLIFQPLPTSTFIGHNGPWRFLFFPSVSWRRKSFLSVSFTIIMFFFLYFFKAKCRISHRMVFLCIHTTHDITISYMPSHVNVRNCTGHSTYTYNRVLGLYMSCNQGISVTHCSVFSWFGVVEIHKIGLDSSIAVRVNGYGPHFN